MSLLMARGKVWPSMHLALGSNSGYPWLPGELPGLLAKNAALAAKVFRTWGRNENVIFYIRRGIVSNRL